MTSSIRLQTRPMPAVEVPPVPAALPAEIYQVRLRRACERARQAGFSHLVVYADREHSANIEYLTGFEPRFEEALLLLSVDGRTKLLVGNECMGYVPDPALEIEIELFQEFSLLGQPRGESRPLRTILTAFGLSAGDHLGAVGWKYFDGRLLPSGAVEIPAYLADMLRGLCGQTSITNANCIFMDAQNGLRATNEPEQIVRFEYAANVAAAGVLNVLNHLEPGATEHELERYMDSRGVPLSCHRMISTGEKARRGLASPSSKRVALGDPYTVAFGVVGGLTCRAGFVARSAADLTGSSPEFYPRLAANYFKVIATWYEAVRIGALGGDIFTAVEAVRDSELYDFAVNPGHQLHLDEWLNSPFALGDMTALKSGMALQMDTIPVSKGPFCYINAEDGIVLADEALQSRLSTEFPGILDRCLRRRTAIRERFGITLHDTVLPLSDLAGWLPPYVMEPTQVFVKS